MTLRFLGLAAALLFGGCSTTVDSDKTTDSGDTSQPDTGSSHDTDTGTTTDTGFFGQAYDGGKYKVVALQLAPKDCTDCAVDVDGNGQPDPNKISTLLDTMAQFFTITDTRQANELIKNILESEQAIVVLDGWMDGPSLHVGMSPATRDSSTSALVPANTEASGHLKNAQTGAFFNKTEWRTSGDSAIVLPFAYESGSELVKFTLLNPKMYGSISIDTSHIKDPDLAAMPLTFGGYLAGAFSVKSIEDDILMPILEDYFSSDTADTDNTQSMRDLAHSLLVAAADVDKNTADPKISAVVRFYAVDATW